MVRAAVELSAGELDAVETHCRVAQSYLDGEVSIADIDLADIFIRQGELVAAKNLLNTVYEQLTRYGILWLAARPVSATLTIALGDRESAAVLVGRTVGHYARSGFGWQRYVDRLHEVQRQLAACRPIPHAASLSVRPLPILRQHF